MENDGRSAHRPNTSALTTSADDVTDVQDAVAKCRCVQLHTDAVDLRTIQISYLSPNIIWM